MNIPFARLRKWLVGLIRFSSVMPALVLAGFPSFGAVDPAVGTVGSHRISDLAVPASGRAGFTRIDAVEAGVRFTNVLSEIASLTNHIYLNGSGVALGDINGDGRVDLVLAGLESPNRVFRNQGAFRFAMQEPGPESCVGQYSTAVNLVDLDGDRDLDLLVNGIGSGTRLFRNDGTGRFQEDFNAGLRQERGAMSMALADVDGNGSLDLYVANYRTWTMRDAFSLRFSMAMVEGRPVVTRVNGRPVTEPDLVGRFTIREDGVPIEHGEVDFLYRNDGSGRFTVIPFSTGGFRDAQGRPLARAPFEWGLGVVFRDINQDGHPDLYVCNDFHSEDRLWMNRGDGVFQEASPWVVRKTSFFSMGTDFADLDRDGLDDFFLTDMLSRRHRDRMRQVSGHMPQNHPVGGAELRRSYVRNMLLFNRGDGEFVELAYPAGVWASEWSWAPVFLDVDLDGFEDLILPTGFARDVQDIDVADEIERERQQRRLSDMDSLLLRRRFPSLALPNLAFRNRGDRTFEDVSQAWGVADISVAQGVALGDLDGDGDLDVVMNCMNDAPLLYRNDSSKPRLAVRLRGDGGNTQGIGARILLRGGAIAEQSQEMQSGGRYLSGDDSMRVFAGNGTGAPMTLEVRWRSGRRSEIRGVRDNQQVEVFESASLDRWRPGQPATNRVWFEDVSAWLGHGHAEELFDDFARQPLLPRRLSQLGPGVAWVDLDGDDREDLVVGSGRGGRLGVFRNVGGERPFQRMEGGFWEKNTERDLLGIVGVRGREGKGRLWVGAANWEDGAPEAGGVRELSMNAPEGQVFPTGFGGSVGPLAVGAPYGQGPLMLFVGCRSVAGRYPEGEGGVVYRMEGVDGAWKREEFSSRALKSAGMVSGAVWTDLDGDGKSELVLACDWGPVRVYGLGAEGHLVERTESWGLGGYRGWWNGVASVDLDGDGQMDLVVSNWGFNHRYQPYRSKPPKIVYADFNGDGAVESWEVFWDTDLGKWVPWHHLGRAAAAFPAVRERFRNYADYSIAGIDEILGDDRAHARELEVTHLESMVFMNRGGRFEAQALPKEAQWAPAFAVVASDFDGDGLEDVFLSQNFFATEPESGRSDDGRGLWLRGNGRGGLLPVTSVESGIRVYGEQRGAAAADFDQDGRMDLVVSQNGGATRLFRNRLAQPGHRVRLQGPPENRDGVGAQMRWVYRGGRRGPVRELQAGSGYLSQNSLATVMTGAEEAEALWIRWPGGREVLVPMKDIRQPIRSPE